MRIHYLQHEPFEGPGSIGHWAEKKGHALTATMLYLDEPTPSPGDIDMLVIMGGGMNIYEEEKFPWLVREKQFIGEVIRSGKPVLGICLGAQLIADVLGGKVTHNALKEIGWFSVELTAAAQSSPLFGFLPPRFDVFHWHGDTFALPPGATHLARSMACENQAFVFDGRVVGLQFHLEFTQESLDAIVAASPAELVPAPFVQTPTEMLRPPEVFQKTNEAMFGLLERLVAKIKS